MKSKTLIINLKRLFYIALITQIILFVSFAFKWISIYSSSTNVSLAIEQYALLLTLLAIPLALKSFSIIINKSKASDSDAQKSALYLKAFMTRFVILFVVASLNIFLYALSYNKNFMLSTLITFTAYIFAYPSQTYLNAQSNESDKNQS